jgi:dolichol-phosphate mannosyltransferase
LKFNRASEIIDPHGFKIALDLLLKADLPTDGITEVPFSFGTRKEGESKLTGKVMLRYIQQLAELYWWKYAGIIFVILIFVASFVVLAVELYRNWDTIAIFK